MSVEFAFAVVPFGRDGSIFDLSTDVPVGGDFTKHLRAGVVWLGVKREDEIPLPLGLGLNMAAMQRVNEHSNFALSELLNDSGGNQSYILLHSRRSSLERLRQSAHAMPNVALRTFVEIFVENAESALSEHGEKAALIIF